MKIENRAHPTFKCAWIIFVIIFLLIAGLLISYIFIDYINYGDNEYLSIDFTTKYSLEEMKNFAFKNSLTKNYRPNLYVKWNLSFNRIFEDSENKFDINSNDVIVFLHIQKTAGTTFERFLVKYLDIQRPCNCNIGKKRCQCLRPNKDNEYWLFSRYSTGWACGLHADYTELSISGCVDHVMDKKEGVHRKRRYFYATFLRNPIERFISEYRHVERGATWLASRHICNGKPPTPEQLPMCFDPEIGWDGVTLNEYLSCPFNLAFNRQTRMLADLTLINCYERNSMNKTTRDKIMLESAKNNLKNLAFFGLKERMEDSQYMFENVFQIKFTKNLADWNKSKSHNTEITKEEMEMIYKNNYLDIQLYDYAVKLFDKRLNLLKSSSTSSEIENYKPKTVFYYKSESNLTNVKNNDDVIHVDDDDDDEDDELSEKSNDYDKP